MQGVIVCFLWSLDWDVRVRERTPVWSYAISRVVIGLCSLETMERGKMDTFGVYFGSKAQER